MYSIISLINNQQRVVLMSITKNVEHQNLVSLHAKELNMIVQKCVSLDATVIRALFVIMKAFVLYLKNALNVSFISKKFMNSSKNLFQLSAENMKILYCVRHVSNFLKPRLFLIFFKNQFVEKQLVITEISSVEPDAQISNY